MGYRIISVESRKGGVGKTTVALNLASILVKRAPVLLIDCDITGTSLVDPAMSSPYWEQETNVLKYVDKKGKTKDLNLIEYFLETFIKGEGSVRDFIKKEILSTRKVNAIGSSLYGSLHEAAINSNWLMDELHSYWLVEFIRLIINEFEGVFSEKTVHIIIDNSPGYTCFGQALHDYMCEIGPQRAKYLLVSTLDSQDLQANVETAIEIYNRINRRVIAANYYLEKEKDEEDVMRDPLVESFIEKDNDIKGFFFQLIDDKRLVQSYQEHYNIEDYLQLVLNKVPQAIQDDAVTIDYEAILGLNRELLYRIVGNNESNLRNIVYYDESIVYQFYMKYLHGNSFMWTQVGHYWNRRLKELNQQVSETTNLSPVNAMMRLNNSFIGLRQSLHEHGYAQLSKQLVPTWAPKYAIENLETSIDSLTKSLFIESNSFSAHKMRSMLSEWFVELSFGIRKRIGGNSVEYAIISDLFDYLYAYTEKGEKISGYPERLLLVTLLMYSLFNALDQWRTEDESFEHFIQEEYHSIMRLRKLRASFDRAIIVNPELSLNIAELGISSTAINRLYRAFCYTIIRLITQYQDIDIIFSAIRLYITPSSSVSYMSREMTDYISDVIYRKTVGYDKQRLAEIKANSFIMKNMRDVLRDGVLKIWK